MENKNYRTPATPAKPSFSMPFKVGASNQEIQVIYRRLGEILGVLPISSGNDVSLASEGILNTQNDPRKASVDPATDKQKELIEKLALKKKRQEYLEDLETLSKSEASLRIKQLLKL